MRAGRTLIALALATVALAHGALADDGFAFGDFGHVTVLRGAMPPTVVVLFVSGADGWSSATADLARSVADRGALVIGVDLRSYRRGLAGGWAREAYPAAEFEALSHYAQRKLGLPTYVIPVIVGDGDGGGLAYATLAQSLPNTFRGAISVGFCPTLSLPKPLGADNSLAVTPGPEGRPDVLIPAERLYAPWIVVQTGTAHCDQTSVQAFVQRVGNAEFVRAAPSNASAAAELANAIDRLAAAPPEDRSPSAPDVQDLPLIEVPANGGPESDIFAVILSGDAGWASVDREIGNALAAAGTPVVGLNTLKYFWTRRTPDSASADLQRVLQHYTEAWRKRGAILIGYARGADVLPFMTSRLPDALRASVPLLVLMAPAPTVDFEVHVSDWLTNTSRGEDLPVTPEIEKLRGTKILCVYGVGDANSICPKLTPGLTTVLPLPGAHHFGGNYAVISRRILDNARNRE